MSRILTLETLKSKKACNEQVELFQELFGDSVEITPELCIKHANDFDFDFYWAARKLLSKTRYDKYDAEKNAAYNEYNAEENVAWNKYCAERQTLDKYNAEEKAAWDKYCAERNAASDKYIAAKALAFANAYINDV